jgi:23S rRNA (uracil1939-C5)-methyltransferase
MDDQLCDLTLTALAYGGEALGRISGDGAPDRVVFVPFALAGERVRVRIVEQKRGFARAELVELLEASPERIQPRCKHFGVCGGCHYQHMPYELQLKAKAGILRDQFRRIGHIDAPAVQDAVGCNDPWHYRNHVQFHLTREGQLAYVAADAASLLPITECHLPEPAINALWPQLEFEPDTDLDRIALRQGAGEEVLLLLESTSPDLPELEVEAGISVVHLFDEHTVVMAGSDRLSMQILERAFRVSAASFFQVNSSMAEKMVSHVLDQVTSLPGAARRPQSNLTTRLATVLDVYCGVGLFSAFLAPLCERLIGIESSAAACEDFASNLDEFDNVELYEDTAAHVLPNLDVQPDLVLVDPPRAGLEPAALDAIVRMQPPVIIYVSCDPATLARDAARLIRGGYRLVSATPFDLFPQTYHIESISLFAL